MPTLSLSFKKPHVGTGEMAQLLRSCSVVAEDLSSVPIPTLGCLQPRSLVGSRLFLETFPLPCEQAQACLMLDEKLHKMRTVVSAGTILDH